MCCSFPGSLRLHSPKGSIPPHKAPLQVARLCSASSKDTHKTLCELPSRKEVGFSIPSCLNQLAAMHGSCITTAKAATSQSYAGLIDCTEPEMLAHLPEETRSLLLVQSQSKCSNSSRDILAGSKKHVRQHKYRVIKWWIFWKYYLAHGITQTSQSPTYVCACVHMLSQTAWWFSTCNFIFNMNRLEGIRRASSLAVQQFVPGGCSAHKN